MNALKTAVIITLCLTSSALVAGSKHNKHAPEQGNTLYDHARVLKVSPIYRQVRVTTPQQECWDEPVVSDYDYHGHGNSASGMAVGGLLGGIIGHQFGQGRGKKLATAMGTLVGAQIGHNALTAGAGSRYSGHSHYEEYCEVKQQVSYQRVVEAYQVSYRYKGKTYQAEMPYRPGKRIKMRIQITPVI